MRSHRALVLALFLSILSSAQNINGPVYGPTNSTWNYTLHGTDWNFTDCLFDKYVQAPINMNNTVAENNTYTGDMAYRWADNGYSVLPTFVSGLADWYGIEQYVYQIFGSNWGGVYLSEPAVNSATNHIVYFETKNIRFHYPSEHMLNGTQYALEMQIFGNDTFNRALGCYSQHAAVSIFFNLDATSANHSFFNWQTNATSGGNVTIDFSTYLKKTAGTTTSFAGYMGTDTMPSCTYGTCWYLLNQIQTINQAELDFFKVPGLDSNARQVDISASTSWTQTFYNYGIFA